MPTKSIVAVLLFAAFSASASTDFYVVVPLGGRAAALEGMTVTLNPSSLPQASVGAAYTTDLSQSLQVQGDSGFTGAGVTWALAAGTSLPPGLQLGASGTVAGTPTQKAATPYSFGVVASYRGKSGQQSYTIQVNGQLLEVVSVSSGDTHTCAVTTAGAVFCWGSNSYGKLGDGTTAGRLSPVQVVGLASGVTSVAAGNNHSCAIQTGAVKCWGLNDSGQLGNGVITNSLIPVAVSGVSANAQGVSTGSNFSCAVVAGAVLCWGANTWGQLGTGDYSASLTAKPVVGLGSGVTKISTQSYGMHSCAVQSGAAKCWGNNNNGMLGTGNYWSYTVPQQVVGFTSGVSDVAAGYYHSCGVQNGAAKCWGIGNYGMLGTGNQNSYYSPAQVVNADSGVVAITAGYTESCLVTSSGTVRCWGNNQNGNLGANGAGLVNSATPLEIPGLSGVVRISGGSAPCAVRADHSLSCWGYNYYGQLGTGTTINTTTPKLVTR